MMLIDFNKYEWESFEFPLRIENVKSLKGFYNIPENCILEINRDTNYKLRARLIGTSNNNKVSDYLVAGEKYEKSGIIESDIFYNDKFEISGIHLADTHYNPKSIDPIEFNFESTVFVNSITEKINKTSVTEKELYFFLSGKILPQLSRSTVRALVDEKLLKGRDGIDDPIEFGEKTKEYSSVRDFIKVNLKDYSFIMQCVHDDYLQESWMNGFLLEFSNPEGKYPEQEEIDAIIEIIGFMLGFQPLCIGRSSFNEENELVNRFAQNPWGNEITHKCSNGPTPPINFNLKGYYWQLEPILNQIIPSYLLWRDSLELKSVIWKYWIGNDMPIGMSLPSYSSGLESLAEKYIKIHNRAWIFNKDEKKTIGAIVKQVKDFINSEELDGFIKDEFDLKQIISNKISNPTMMGVGLKLKVFFEIIGIHYDNKSMENLALRARNIMAHSSIGSSDEEIKNALIYTRAYETLYHRTILILLGFKGKYVDLSSPDRLDLKLSENMIGASRANYEQ